MMIGPLGQVHLMATRAFSEQQVRDGPNAPMETRVADGALYRVDTAECGEPL